MTKTKSSKPLLSVREMTELATANVVTGKTLGHQWVWDPVRKLVSVRGFFEGHLPEKVLLPVGEQVHPRNVVRAYIMKREYWRKPVRRSRSRSAVPAAWLAAD